MKIKLRKFNPSQIPKDGRIIMVIGRRGTGKTTLINDLLYHLHERYDFCVGMSPTKSSIDMLEASMPYALVFDEGFSLEQFQKLLAICSLLARKTKSRNGILTMDDCNADKDAFRNKSMRDAFFNGRQYGLSIMWGMHYVMDILPDLRTQVDFIFVLKDLIRKNKERLFNNFFGMFEKLDDFIKVMDQCTENNECLVLDNTRPNPDPRECLYWYKAQHRDTIPAFRIGRPVFYMLSQIYRKEDTEEDEILKVRISAPGAAAHGNGMVFLPKVLKCDEANPRVEIVEKQH